MHCKPYHQIPICDCGEPLVPITLAEVHLTLPPPYQQLGADYQGRSPYVLRSGVLEALAQAQTQLHRAYPGWHISIFDAYRPVQVQQFMVDYTFEQILQEQGLRADSLSPEARQAILAQVYTIWASPSLDPQTPPPHSTGAALDITLLDQNGELVDMGGVIDELSPRSQPAYYQHQPSSKAQRYHQHREILHQVMVTAGFLRHPGEWWHFSWGDQLWAWQYNQINPHNPQIARYGRVVFGTSV